MESLSTSERLTAIEKYDILLLDLEARRRHLVVNNYCPYKKIFKKSALAVFTYRSKGGTMEKPSTQKF